MLSDGDIGPTHSVDVSDPDQVHRFFVWHRDNGTVALQFQIKVELGRAAKNSKKGKRVIRRWRLDRFGDDEVKLRYQNGLRAEVHGFSESGKLRGA